MLQNYLKSLEITGHVRHVKLILLVTGCKQYGVHLGQVKNPMLESDPWLRDPAWPPNFYYRQQDILKDFCDGRLPRVNWVVTYPNDVIGFAHGNFMNLASGVGLYAAVSKEMGLDLIWPGSEAFYTKFDSFTTSKLHAEFCRWAALTPEAANKAFNVVNEDVESWQNLWPRVAKFFGMKVKKDQFADAPSKWAGETILPSPPPISVHSDQVGLKGGSGRYGLRIPPSKLEQRINLVKWSKDPQVKAAWNRLAEREGLQKDAFEKATWDFLDFILGRNYDVVASMKQARKCGWVG